MVSSQVFEIIVKRYQTAVRRFLVGLTDGDEMLADDLAQDTFIKAFYTWDAFEALCSPKTWLMRIAYTTFVDYTRAHRLTEELEGVDSPTEHQTNTDMRLDIQTAMHQLAPNERVCVHLALVEERTMRQIASITGMNENTVKSHLRRGKDKLKQYLIANGYDR